MTQLSHWLAPTSPPSSVKVLDVVDRLDTFVKGVVPKDRQVTCRLFVFRFPFVKTLWNIAAHKESQ